MESQIVSAVVLSWKLEISVGRQRYKCSEAKVTDGRNRGCTVESTTPKNKQKPQKPKGN